MRDCLQHTLPEIFGLFMPEVSGLGLPASPLKSKSQSLKTCSAIQWALIDFPLLAKEVVYWRKPHSFSKGFALGILAMIGTIVFYIVNYLHGGSSLWMMQRVAMRVCALLGKGVGLGFRHMQQGADF